MEAEIQDAVLTVKSSDVREQILRNLYRRNERVRPSKVLESIEDEMETSSGNFYMNLDQLLEKNLVEKMEGDNRATLYWLSERGKRVAEELEDEWESQEAADANAANRPGGGQQAASRSASADSSDIESEVDPELVNKLRDFLAVIPYTPDEVIKAANQIKQQ